MKHARTILFVLFVFFASLNPLFADETPEETEQNGVKTLSVLYFSNNSRSEELGWLEKGLADMVITDLSFSDRIRIVEREELEEVLKEQRLMLSGLTEDNYELEIGKLLSAQLIVAGSFASSGSGLRIDAKVLDTETGELITAVKTEGSADGLFDLEAALVSGILEGLGLHAAEQHKESGTYSLEAAAAYYRGLQLSDGGEYEKALEYYRQAAAADPEYAKPRSGIEESYRFLKDFRAMRHQREINKLLSESAAIRERLGTEPWITYSDFIMQAYADGETDNAKLTEKAEALGLFSGETPAVAVWNLQNKLRDIASLSIEYFEDETLADHAGREIVSLSVEAREKYREDPFLPEIIYQELLTVHYKGLYEGSMALCEELMINYPDFRMMWAVEDFYEESLEQLSE